MKRVLSLLLIVALTACCLLALASCTVKFGSSKSTDAPSSSTSGSTTTAGGNSTATDGTAPSDTTAPPASTAPEGSGLPIAEDTDNDFGPLIPF